jgi:hypothetical protein
MDKITQDKCTVAERNLYDFMNMPRQHWELYEV